jgi:hypothetical protein
MSALETKSEPKSPTPAHWWYGTAMTLVRTIVLFTIILLIAAWTGATVPGMILVGIVLVVGAAVVMAGPIFGPEKVSIVVTVPVTLYIMFNAATGAEAVLELFCSIPLFGAVMALASLDG